MKNFCDNEIRIDDSNGRVYMSKICYWYGNDFRNDIRKQLNIVSQYCTGIVKDKL